jgi:hypothetical protein
VSTVATKPAEGRETLQRRAFTRRSRLTSLCQSLDCSFGLLYTFLAWLFPDFVITQYDILQRLNFHSNLFSLHGQFSSNFLLDRTHEA